MNNSKEKEMLKEIRKHAKWAGKQLEKIKQEEKTKYLFIFNGRPMTGKTMLSKLLDVNQCKIIDNFYFRNYIGGIDKEKIKDVITRIDESNIKYWIIITNDKQENIKRMTDMIKLYLNENLKISRLNFKRQ